MTDLCEGKMGGNSPQSYAWHNGDIGHSRIQNRNICSWKKDVRLESDSQIFPSIITLPSLKLAGHLLQNKANLSPLMPDPAITHSRRNFVPDQVNKTTEAVE